MKFKIGVVLSASYGKLLCPIGGVYKILNFMLDENLFTHQLPRASRFAAPFILKQHPQLSEWSPYDPQVNTENWRGMLAEAEKMFGSHLEIEKVPAGVWTYKDPIEEAEDMVGKDKVIAVQTQEPRP